MSKVLRKLALGSLVAALMAGTASADTLREALQSTYQSNPTITGQREPPAGRRSVRPLASIAT